MSDLFGCAGNGSDLIGENDPHILERSEVTLMQGAGRPCAVPGCVEHCKENQLMCIPHWAMVTENVQSRIWYFWRRGDGFQHRRACRDAIHQVEQREKTHEGMA